MAAKRLLLLGLMTTLFGSGYLLGSMGEGALVPEAEASPIPIVQAERVFELRTWSGKETWYTLK